jgi:transcriptional regulator with XRE-family HTH domain
MEVLSTMNSKNTIVMPETQKILEQMGEQIKLARLRRKLSAKLVAERAGISRSTLWNVERGVSSVAIGSYAAVLHALGKMEKDLLLVAKDDVFGRKLQDIELSKKRGKELI